MKRGRYPKFGLTPDWILEREGLITGKPKRSFKPSIAKRLGDASIVVMYAATILLIVFHAFKG